VRITFTVLLLVLVGCDNADRFAADGSDELDPTANLVAWWKFEDGSGATVTDSSGHGNTGTVRNGDVDDAESNGALKMNGGNDSIVTVPISESLRSTSSEITVMSWTYRSDEHNVAVVAHEYPTLFFGFHGPQFKWQIASPRTLFTRVARRLGISRATGAACYADPRHRAVLDEWIHMAATYDGWRARLYVDGIEICNRWFWGSISMPDSPFTLSGYLDKAGKIVDEISGALDDVRIYNRALSETEIRAVYSAGME